MSHLREKDYVEYDVCYVCGKKVSDSKICAGCEEEIKEYYKKLKESNEDSSFFKGEDFPSAESLIQELTKDPLSKKQLKKYNKRYSKDLYENEKIFYAGYFGPYTIQE